MLDNMAGAAGFMFSAAQVACGTHLLLTGARQLTPNPNGVNSTSRAVGLCVLGLLNLGYGCIGMYICSESETLLSHRSIQQIE